MPALSATTVAPIRSRYPDCCASGKAGFTGQKTHWERRHARATTTVSSGLRVINSRPVPGFHPLIAVYTTTLIHPLIKQPESDTAPLQLERSTGGLLDGPVTQWTVWQLGEDRFHQQRTFYASSPVLTGLTKAGLMATGLPAIIIPGVRLPVKTDDVSRPGNSPGVHWALSCPSMCKPMDDS